MYVTPREQGNLGPGVGISYRSRYRQTNISISKRSDTIETPFHKELFQLGQRAPTLTIKSGQFPIPEPLKRSFKEANVKQVKEIKNQVALLKHEIKSLKAKVELAAALERKSIGSEQN